MTDIASFDRACRERYVSFLTNTYRNGLDSAAIEKSRTTLCETRDGKCYLRDIAYKPTGIALGCPLPDERIAAHLAAFADNFEGYLQSLEDSDDSRETNFARVPADWYHITLVNQGHYNAGLESAIPISVISTLERQIRDLLCDAGPITVRLDRVLITPHGGLLAAGYPTEDTLYRLRESITRQIPQLDVHTPRTAHIKLGHVQTVLAPDRLRLLLRYVRQIGHLNEQIRFGHAYTPSGSFSLSCPD